MKQRRIGDRHVGAIGLGCMGMSWAYGPADRQESIRTLERALELGVDHWDTADLYGGGENERLLAHVLKTRRDDVFLATKFGNVYDRSVTTHQDLVAANASWIVDGTPRYVRICIERSLERLGVDVIDLYYLHRVDERVPIEDTVGAMARLVEEGKVRFLGLSEVAADTLRRAHAVHPIAAVQSEYSLWTRDVEQDVIPAVREIGSAFVPYSPLGRGFLAGAFASNDEVPEGDWRKTNPRFVGDNFRRNLSIVGKLERIAREKGATPAQVALAWVAGRAENVLPIPGTKRVKWLEQNAAAIDLELTPDERSDLEDFVVSGDRYTEAMMRFTKR